MTPHRALQAPIPLVDQVAELQRELEFRRNRWPRKVESGAFNREACAVRIARLEAALATLQSLCGQIAPMPGRWPSR